MRLELLQPKIADALESSNRACHAWRPDVAATVDVQKHTELWLRHSARLDLRSAAPKSARCSKHKDSACRETEKQSKGNSILTAMHSLNILLGG